MPPFETTAPVVVLGARHGGLGAARSLGRLGVPVYAVQGQQKAPALSSRYWRRTFFWDFARPSADSTQFLLEIAEAIGRRCLLLATTDPHALFIADNAEALREAFVFPPMAPTMVAALVHKWKMRLLAEAEGISTPEAVFPRSMDEVVAFLRRAIFPLMIKAVDPRLPQDRYNAIVPSQEDLMRRLAALGADGLGNLMLQEYIPGGDESVWMFNGYFNARGECLAGFTGQKIRQWPPYHGVTSLGVCAPNPIVERTARDLMKRLGYHGILDAEFRYDARDGQYKLLDVNPRLGDTFRLFVAPEGLDVVRAFYLDMTGQHVPAAAALAGRKWLLEEDLFSSRWYLRDRRVSLWAWAQSMRGIRETAWFAPDDPLPFMHWLVARVGTMRSRGMRWLVARVGTMRSRGMRRLAARVGTMRSRSIPSP